MSLPKAETKLLATSSSCNLNQAGETSTEPILCGSCQEILWGEHAEGIDNRWRRVRTHLGALMRSSSSFHLKSGIQSDFIIGLRGGNCLILFQMWNWNCFQGQCQCAPVAGSCQAPATAYPGQSVQHSLFQAWPMLDILQSLWHLPALLQSKLGSWWCHPTSFLGILDPIC